MRCYPRRLVCACVVRKPRRKPRWRSRVNAHIFRFAWSIYFTGNKTQYLIILFQWFYGVMVSTLDSESSDPSSSLGRTLSFYISIWLKQSLKNIFALKFDTKKVVLIKSPPPITICLLVWSADNLCKHFSPRSGPTNRPAAALDPNCLTL